MGWELYVLCQDDPGPFIQTFPGYDAVFFFPIEFIHDSNKVSGEALSKNITHE